MDFFRHTNGFAGVGRKDVMMEYLTLGCPLFPMSDPTSWGIQAMRFRTVLDPVFLVIPFVVLMFF